MDCFKCRELLCPSTDFLVKEESESKIVNCITCVNIECDEVGQEFYPGSTPNVFYRANRRIEGLSVADLVRIMDLKLDTSLDLDAIVLGILSQFPDQASIHKAGKKDLIGFFMGKLMKETKNSVDPKMGRDVISRLLNG